MLKFIIVNLFKIIYPFISRKFNFSPKVDNLVNTVFKTNYCNSSDSIQYEHINRNQRWVMSDWCYHYWSLSILYVKKETVPMSILLHYKQII